MKTSTEIAQALDELEASLPAMLDEHDEDCDFWCAFAGQADAITEAAAGEDYEYAMGRVDAMLRAVGKGERSESETPHQSA